jgi:hypothetical protein
MSQAGLDSFGAYQKDRALFESYYFKRISVSTQAEQAGAFSRPFGTWGSHFNVFPGLKAWAIFDCPSGTGQQDLFSGHIRGLCGPYVRTVPYTGSHGSLLPTTLNTRPSYS